MLFFSPRLFLGGFFFCFFFFIRSPPFFFSIPLLGDGESLSESRVARFFAESLGSQEALSFPLVLFSKNLFQTCRVGAGNDDRTTGVLHTIKTDAPRTIIRDRVAGTRAASSQARDVDVLFLAIVGDREGGM